MSFTKLIVRERIRTYDNQMVSRTYGQGLEKIGDLIKRVDVVIEVLDARLPFSSSNHKLEEIRRTKPWIKILNKHDLADPSITKVWVKLFEQQAGVRALPMSSKQSTETKQLNQALQAAGAQRGKARLSGAGDGGRHPQRGQIDPDQHPGRAQHGQGRATNRPLPPPPS